MAISKNEVQERVKRVIAEQLGVAEADVREAASLTEDLGADSLDKVELVMAIEDEFELEIDDDVAASKTTPGAIIEHVAQALGAV